MDITNPKLHELFNNTTDKLQQRVKSDMETCFNQSNENPNTFATCVTVGMLPTPKLCTRQPCVGAVHDANAPSDTQLPGFELVPSHCGLAIKGARFCHVVT